MNNSNNTHSDARDVPVSTCKPQSLDDFDIG